MARKVPTPKSQSLSPNGTNSDALEEVYPQGIEITLKDSRVVTIQAFDFDEIPEAARYVVEFGVAFDKLNFQDPAVILALFTRNVEPGFKLISLFVRRNLMQNYPDEFKNANDVVQYVKKLKGLDGGKIAMAGAKMNIDFFVQLKEFGATLWPGLWAKLQTNSIPSEQPTIGSSFSPSLEEDGQEAKSIE